MAPDLERFARMPWPVASLASSGTRVLSSALACSCSRCAARVWVKIAANSAQALEAGHIHHTNRLKPQLGWLDPEQLGLFATFDTPPELALRGDNQVLIERIGMGEDLNPFAAAGDY